MDTVPSLQNLLERICSNAGGQPVPVRGVTHDSRQVIPGVIYVALPGARTDGHCFLEDAARQGAVALVVERLPDSIFDIPVVQVSDSRQALSVLASAFHLDPSSRLRVTGITGTNGKTTVAYFLKQLLEACGNPTGLMGTVNYEIGNRKIPAPRTTPEAPVVHDLFAQMLRADCSDVVMEVSSHALAQQRVRDVKFNAAVFTNLTQDHLDYHGTLEEYFKAKASLFAHAHLEYRIVGVDDEYGQRLASAGGAGTLVTFGFAKEAQIRAILSEQSMQGSRGLILFPGGEFPFFLPSPGRHNVLNLLAAFATALAYGCPCARLTDAITNMKAAPGRMDVLPGGTGSVVVDYAHTPDALVHVMETLRPLTKGKLMVVIGCGGNRDREKRAPMFRAVYDHADRVIVTQDNPRSEDPQQIVADMLKGTEDCEDVDVIMDRKEAIHTGIKQLQDGDLLLIAGKGHEDTQEFSDRVVPFDDRVVARKLLAEGAQIDA